MLQLTTVFMYRSYKGVFWFNDELYPELLIDPHFEVKHSASISDDLIIKLVRRLHLSDFELSGTKSGYGYYKVNAEYLGKLYRLILVVPLHREYLGVRNAHRRSK